MFGQLPDLIKTFRDSKGDLQEELFRASTEDRCALASQSTESQWIVINVKEIAVGRVSDFLPIQEDIPIWSRQTC
jgi:hypothetical protein